MKGVFFGEGILDFFNYVFLMLEDLKFSLGRRKEFYWELRQLQKVLLDLCSKEDWAPSN